MKPTIWLRSAEQTWLESATDDKGTLSISRIGARTNLHLETLVLGPNTLGVYEGITIEEIRDICGSTGQLKELVVLADGITKPDARPEGPENHQSITRQQWLKQELPGLKLAFSNQLGLRNEDISFYPESVKIWKSFREDVADYCSCPCFFK